MATASPEASWAPASEVGGRRAATALGWVWKAGSNPALFLDLFCPCSYEGACWGGNGWAKGGQESLSSSDGVGTWNITP